MLRDVSVILSLNMPTLHVTMLILELVNKSSDSESCDYRQSAEWLHFAASESESFSTVCSTSVCVCLAFCGFLT